MLSGPWSDVRQQLTDEASSSMSHSPQSEGRPSNIQLRSYGIPPTPAGGSTDTSSSRHGSISSQRDVVPRTAPALPSLATLTGEFEVNREPGRSGSPTSYRSLGVHNILNPSSEAPSQHAYLTQSSPQANSTPRSHGLHAIPTASPHVRKRGEPHSPVVEVQAQPGGRAGRRILTPRSPRAASLGAHRSPSTGAGVITRIPLPSGGGRIYTAEPGDSRDSIIPPLPAISTARAPFPGQSSRDLVSPTVQNTTVNSGYSATGRPGPPPESRPEPHRPPYSSAEAAPPNYAHPPRHMTNPPAVTSHENQANYLHPASGPVRSTLPYGQTDFQLTFETQQGPMVVPVNVDYQQASRLADEKRKRNAGASARFRARRKEKEREANSTISGLQQELQDLMDEREFYLRERNFFRDLLARSNPGPLPVRPHSPQARRPHQFSSAVSEGSSSVDYRHQDAEAQRRATGEYPPTLTSQSPGTPYNHSFPPSGPPMTLPTPPTPNTYSDPRAGPPGPPPPPPNTRPPPYDPLRRNTLDRDWTAGR